MEENQDQPPSYLIEENVILKKELEYHLSIIEDQKQELYTTQKKLEFMNAMKIDMEVEIDSLNKINVDKNNLESHVRSLEYELTTIQLKSTSLENQLVDERNTYETELSGLTSRILELQTTLSGTREVADEEIRKEFTSKLLALQDENKSLVKSHENLKNENKELLEKVYKLGNDLGEKIHELEEINEILQVKSEDLKSATALVKELQEEKVLLNTELSILKAGKGSHNSRGNSLFAEVEDKRLSTASKLDSFQNKYKELKKVLMKKNAEINVLEHEISKLRKQWKDDKNDPYEAISSLVEGYKIRISELTQMISKLNTELPPISNDGFNTGMNCLKSMVEYERKRYRELVAEMEQCSIRELFQSEQMFDLRREIRCLKSQMKQDADLIAELKNKLEKFESRVSGITNDSPPTSSLKNITNGKADSSGTNNYSNIEDKLSKTVRFDETIMDTTCVNHKQQDKPHAFKKPAFQKVRSIKIGRENIAPCSKET